MGQIGQATPLTQPEDFQRWLGQPVINLNRCPIGGGGAVSGRSDLAFDVASGLGYIPTSFGAQVITWAALTTSAVTPPATGSVTVYVWVAADGQVSTGTTRPPAAHILLDGKVIAAGATSTAGAPSVVDRIYALRLDSTLPDFDSAVESPAHGTLISATESTAFDRRFALPTDRRVAIEVATAVTTNKAEYDTNDQASAFPGSLWLRLLVDGAERGSVEVPYDRMFALRTVSFELDLTFGAHTYQVKRRKYWGAKAAMMWADGPTRGGVRVRDLGVTQ